MFLLQLPIVALADIDLPVEGGVVTSGVGWRIDPFGTGKFVFHRGIDIAVPVGTQVLATRKGRVIFAGDHKGHGITVIIEHTNGDRTLYGHNSMVRVHPGDVVEAGSLIAFSGNSGRSTGPHVHFEQLPSGRVVFDEIEPVDTRALELADNSDQSHMIEQIMNESVDAVIRKIRGTIENKEKVGHGG